MKTLAIVSHDNYIYNLADLVGDYLMPFVEVGSMSWFDADGAKYLTAAEAYEKIESLQNKIDSVVDSEGFWEDLPDAFETLVLEANEDDLVVLVDYEEAA